MLNAPHAFFATKKLMNTRLRLTWSLNQIQKFLIFILGLFSIILNSRFLYLISKVLMRIFSTQSDSLNNGVDFFYTLQKRPSKYLFLSLSVIFCFLNYFGHIIIQEFSQTTSLEKCFALYPTVKIRLINRKVINIETSTSDIRPVIDFVLTL